MRRLARATATGLATLSVSASFTAAMTGPATASAASTRTPHRAIGTAAVAGYFLLQKSPSRGAAAQAVLICETVRAATGPDTVSGFGNVTDPTAACRELVAVDGDFARLLVHPTWMVPALEAPVSVTVSGAWTSRGQVSYQRTFRNTGELGRSLGDVFAF
jgi:hypothetical protein